MGIILVTYVVRSLLLDIIQHNNIDKMQYDVKLFNII